jgi:anaerobic ribonucleoside-triphosphate reductase
MKTYKKINCHDCKKEMLEEDLVMTYEVGKNTYFKCEACHKKDPDLANYQPCEVYSRVVGYIRPVDGWNAAKKAEFKDRKNFKIT